MSFPESQFASRSRRGRRRVKITVREFRGEGPGFELCICRVCGPCDRDAERDCRWCKRCINRECWWKHENKGLLERFFGWLSGRGGRSDDRGESTVYYVGRREDER